MNTCVIQSIDRSLYRCLCISARKSTVGALIITKTVPKRCLKLRNESVPKTLCKKSDQTNPTHSLWRLLVRPWCVDWVNCLMAQSEVSKRVASPVRVLQLRKLVSTCQAWCQSKMMLWYCLVVQTMCPGTQSGHVSRNWTSSLTTHWCWTNVPTWSLVRYRFDEIRSVWMRKLKSSTSLYALNARNLNGCIQ